jgi:hypothetical protein
VDRHHGKDQTLLEIDRQRDHNYGLVDVLVVVFGLTDVLDVVGEPVDFGGIVVGVVAILNVVGVVVPEVLVVLGEFEVVVVERLVEVVVEVGVSGETQPAGAVVGPTCPGMRTVPAQPKLLKSALTVTDPPSEN